MSNALDLPAPRPFLPRRLSADGWWLAATAAGPAWAGMEPGFAHAPVLPESRPAMTLASPLADMRPASRPSARAAIGWMVHRLALVLAGAALADWLFFNSAPIGLSLPLFFLGCGALVLTANPVRAGRRGRIMAAAAFALALAVLVEDVSWLSVLVSGTLLLYAARLLVFPGREGWMRRLLRSWGMPFTGPVRLGRDAIRVHRLAPGAGVAWVRGWRIETWLVPMVLTLVFLTLFSAANPVLAEWLGALDPRRLTGVVSVPRLIFWALAACLLWPLVHLTARRARTPARVARGPVERRPSHLFGPAAVLRSLILFNALFALQTSLDVAYLWGGLDLPEGMTYASYAHRGAYPLIVTALLAAAFVLIAMRPAGPAEASPRIRPLVLVFVAQNMMLVASSVWRTMLYVDAYGLTELRLAALIWMALVGLGLILIVVQIRTRRSNGWLLDANAMAVAATLVLCCFANFPYMVARYNVTHWQERGGMPDMYYMSFLGPQALPAVLPILTGAEPGHFAPSQLTHLRHLDEAARDTLADAGWRGWSFRDFRLKRFLDAHPLPPLPAPAP